MNGNQQNPGVSAWIRKKALFRGCFCLVITVSLGVVLYLETSDSIRLASRGRAAVAVVGKYHLQTSRHSKGSAHYYHYHNLYYDGHSKQVDLGRRYERGVAFNIVYLPDDPSVVRFGDNSTTFWHFLRQDAGWLSLGVSVALFTLFSFGAACYLTKAGRRKPD